MPESALLQSISILQQRKAGKQQQEQCLQKCRFPPRVENSESDGLEPECQERVDIATDAEDLPEGETNLREVSEDQWPDEEGEDQEESQDEIEEEPQQEQSESDEKSDEKAPPQRCSVVRRVRSNSADPVALAQKRVQRLMAARRRARRDERRDKALSQCKFDTVNIEAFRKATLARLSGNDLPQSSLNLNPAASLDLPAVEQQTSKPSRRKIAVVGGGPVGLWAATLIMLRHARRVKRMAAGSGATAAKANSGFIRGADAPEIVIFERRAPEDHCSRRNVRITLDAHTVALLNKHTKSNRFVSGMALAEIESILLEQWRRLGGPKGIQYGSHINTPQEVAQQDDWDLVLWAGGRWSINDATRSDLDCDMRVGEHEEVIVFEMRNFAPSKRQGGKQMEDLELLAAADLTFSAKHAAEKAVPMDSEVKAAYRIVLRVGQDAQTGEPLCWLWFMGLPDELKAAKAAAGPPSRDHCNKCHESIAAALEAELDRLALLPESSEALPWVRRLMAAAGALQDRVMSPGEVSGRWVDASYWSADRVVCSLPPGPSGRIAPMVLVGDAAMGKPFYTGTTLNVHLAEVKSFSRLPVIRWGQPSGESSSQRRASRFTLSADKAVTAPFQSYEDRYQQLLLRTPGLQRRAPAEAATKGKAGSN
mmetsp:Transcript_24402/g.44207  ORF Transcript_24402/g.44207 Transcript_24402/m.44207 type:complete len:652 (+) Transcript_24402:17-1972(+)